MCKTGLLISFYRRWRWGAFGILPLSFLMSQHLHVLVSVDLSPSTKAKRQERWGESKWKKTTLINLANPLYWWPGRGGRKKTIIETNGLSIPKKKYSSPPGGRWGANYNFYRLLRARLLFKSPIRWRQCFFEFSELPQQTFLNHTSSTGIKKSVLGGYLGRHLSEAPKQLITILQNFVNNIFFLKT